MEFSPEIHTSSVEYTTRYLNMGFQMVTLGADGGFMSTKATTDLAAVREGGGVQALRTES